MPELVNKAFSKKCKLIKAWSISHEVYRYHCNIKINDTTKNEVTDSKMHKLTTVNPLEYVHQELTSHRYIYICVSEVFLS